MIAQMIATLHDWLSGSPKSQQDRIQVKIAEQSHKPFTGRMGF